MAITAKQAATVAARFPDRVGSVEMAQEGWAIRTAWFHLKPGWMTSNYEHAVHAYTRAEAVEALGSLEPCDCEGCTKEQRR